MQVERLSDKKARPPVDLLGQGQRAPDSICGSKGTWGIE